MATRPQSLHILHSAITLLIRFILRSLLSLLVIAVILAGGRYLLEQGRILNASNEELATLVDVNADIAAFKQKAISLVRITARKAGSESLGEVDARIRAVSETLRANRTGQEPSLLLSPFAGPGKLKERLASHYKRRLISEVAGQELAYLQQLRSYLVAISDRGMAARELERLRLVHVAAFAVLTQRKNELVHPDLADRVLINVARRIGQTSRLETRRDEARGANNNAALAYQHQLEVLQHINRLKLPVFLVNEGAIDAATQSIVDRLEHTRTAVATNLITQLTGPVVAVLPLAVLVLVSSVAGHLLVKMLFYFVLAPLAERRKPIRLEAATDAHRASMHNTAGRQTKVSAVSQEIELQSEEVLLILPEFLQSSSVDSIKDTKWLLDWSCPWTSLVSGMVMLTRIRTKRYDDRIVISSNADPMSEIALVTIPAGSAMVFQPRGMIGVIYASATPLKISRRWRLFSAHAWLTLQLRYLIFRGPVTLIVSGSRGVRIEPAGQARTIGQYATLGFSAHLNYATVRGDTFWSYYQNRTALLQDKFEGDNGYYVYDETPRSGKGGGFFARGLEGVTDAVLKVFGI